MPRIFINLEAGCLQVNLMSTSAQINQLKYTILYYTILSKSLVLVVYLVILFTSIFTSVASQQKKQEIKITYLFEFFPSDWLLEDQSDRRARPIRSS